MQEKTNVMRMLDYKNIWYKPIIYKNMGVISGVDVATALNENPKQAFKTLVTRGNSKNYYVFVIPVSQELDLKKAAKCANEKSIEMIAQKNFYLLLDIYMVAVHQLE